MQRRNFIKTAMCVGTIGCLGAMTPVYKDIYEDYQLKNDKFYYKSKKDLPKVVRLEACSLCQLDCPCCKVRQLQKDAPKGWLGYLKFEDFKKFVDDNDFEEIMLSNNGEMFLNPDLDKIMEYAFKKGVMLSAGNGVNFNTVSEKTLENLVKYKFRFLAIAIDGATPETYAIYRKGGDLNQVFHNIERVNYYKKKYNSFYPRLVYQYIIFGHNEHEIELAQKKAEELDMKFKFKKNYDPNYSPVKSEKAKKIVDSLPRRNPDTDCDMLFTNPQIDFDGSLLGCCSIRYGSFGHNVFKSGLLKALNSRNIIYAKHMLTDLSVPAKKEILCTNCYIYKTRRKNNKVMVI